MPCSRLNDLAKGEIVCRSSRPPKNVHGYCLYAFKIKLRTADQLRRNNNNCVVIIELMLKQNRCSVCQSYFNCAFIAPKSPKRKNSTYIKPQLTLCYSTVGILKLTHVSISNYLKLICYKSLTFLTFPISFRQLR